jgi:methionyl aminopeptidase
VIICKSPAELVRMKAANALVADILVELREAVKPGVTTADLDALAESRVRAAQAEPAFKGYHGYPATICASVNEEVVHGIPSRRELVEGDIIAIDLGVVLDGYYGDAAVTLPVGRVSEQAAALLRVTEESLHKAIAQVKVGARISDLGAAVQGHVEAHGFSVVREFVGHGIGQKLHEEPQIPNYGPAAAGPAGRGHGAGDRAHGEPGQGAGDGAVGRVDGGDEGRQLSRPLRAHGGRHAARPLDV